MNYPAFPSVTQRSIDDLVHAQFVPRMPLSEFKNYMKQCGQEGSPDTEVADAGPEFSSIHRKRLAMLKDPKTPSAHQKAWLLSVATT